MLQEEQNHIPEAERRKFVMGIISFKHSGSFKNTERFFSKALNADYKSILEVYGEKGVSVLRQATPRDSGETANSWGYTIEDRRGKLILTFTNSNIQKGVNIAIILNYGHGTASGAYVAGRNYIDPAIQPIFDKIADDVWKEVIA
jgi:hypothetical protein